ncbi:TRAG family protein [Desnuesiella massiliensis]|uniref:TRAG family protein n=1 Tax=Desnuesiella massiliensis TaxID=1650662 RepID=UPI001FA79330|nr:TRAG family protein [Desnuesiella massiliensis]
MKLLPINECLKSIFISRQHLMLFLCLQGFVLVMAVMYFFTNLRPYQSDLVEITPDIKIPVPVGQYQHGSARWLKDEEKDKAFDSFILDPNHPQIMELIKTGYDGLEFMGNSKIEND